jgi:hypothetical protein
MSAIASASASPADEPLTSGRDRKRSGAGGEDLAVAGQVLRELGHTEASDGPLGRSTVTTQVIEMSSTSNDSPGSMTTGGRR